MSFHVHKQCNNIWLKLCGSISKLERYKMPQLVNWIKKDSTFDPGSIKRSVLIKKIAFSAARGENCVVIKSTLP